MATKIIPLKRNPLASLKDSIPIVQNNKTFAGVKLLIIYFSTSMSNGIDV